MWNFTNILTDHLGALTDHQHFAFCFWRLDLWFEMYKSRVDMWRLSGWTRRDPSLKCVSTTDLISSYFPKSYGEIPLALRRGNRKWWNADSLPGFRTHSCTTIWSSPMHAHKHRGHCYDELKRYNGYNYYNKTQVMRKSGITRHCLHKPEPNKTLVIRTAGITGHFIHTH